MRASLILSGCLMLSAMPAMAAGPALSGVYLLSQTELCQATVASTNPNSTTQPASNPGTFAQAIGTATLTPTNSGGSSGTLSVTQLRRAGSLLLFASGATTTGSAMSGSVSTTYSGTYSATNTSIVFTFTGQSSQTLTAQFGAPVSGVVRTAMATGSTGTDCTEQFIFIHQ